MPKEEKVIREAWVLGSGKSGLAAAKLLESEGYSVSVFDSRPLAINDDGISNVVYGVHSLPANAPEMIVISPGLGPENPLRSDAEKRNLHIISELSLGVSRLRCKKICVTGSKGKSSLVKLLADTLSLAGRCAEPCGNYGIPVCEVAMMNKSLDFAVVECSSFQMEFTRELAPDAAIFLNLSPDHLDRHGTMAEYRKMKMRIFEGMSASGLSVFPDENGLKKSRGAASLENAVDIICSDEKHSLFKGSYFDNPVLFPAAIAAIEILRHVGLTDKKIEDGFKAFIPLRHRMELVAEKNGIKFINDSKATSLAALTAAVRMISRDVLLIAGGRAKEKITGNGKELLEKGVKKAYLIGECALEMESAWKPFLPVEVCGVLEEAVVRAMDDALPGDTVLLSPGTASFDQFKNFEERGCVFVHLVKELEENGDKQKNE